MHPDDFLERATDDLRPSDDSRCVSRNAGRPGFKNEVDDRPVIDLETRRTQRIQGPVRHLPSGLHPSDEGGGHFTWIQLVAVMLVVPFVGREVSPFRPGDDFALTHMLPHALGLAPLIACRFLAFGNDHKGAWPFSAAPESSLRPFASGVHAALWVVLVAAPHLAWLLFFGWDWGLPDAAGFVVFSAAVASLYLAGALRLVDGLSFGRPSPGTRTSLPISLGIAVLILAAIAVGIQLLLFRSAVAVGVATLVVAAGAYLLARVTLPGFESRIRSSLHRAPSGSMFRFVGEHED